MYKPTKKRDQVIANDAKNGVWHPYDACLRLKNAGHRWPLGEPECFCVASEMVRLSHG
jgi:hypothetical protein